MKTLWSGSWIWGVLCFLVWSCGASDPTAHLVELDLLSHGMPIVILAPEDPDITSMNLVIQKDMTVQKGEQFALQIFESDATTRDESQIKQRLLVEVQQNAFYQKIMTDEEHGFIYQTAIDSSYINYGFRYFRIQGDKEYLFQQSLQGKFSLEDVELMYAAVSTVR